VLCNQALGPVAGASRRAWAANDDRVEGLREERDFYRGRGVQVCSQRSTRPIDRNH
jgi:hypothetical protein